MALSIKHKIIISTSFGLLGYQFRTSSSFNSAFDSYRFLKVFEQYIAMPVRLKITHRATHHFFYLCNLGKGVG